MYKAAMGQIFIKKNYVHFFINDDVMDLKECAVMYTMKFHFSLKEKFALLSPWYFVSHFVQDFLFLIVFDIIITLTDW